MNNETITGDFLVDKIGIMATYELAAEEATELAHACQKLARCLRGDNPVFGYTGDELVMDMHEEFADLIICYNSLKRVGALDSDVVRELRHEKEKRMRERLS